MNYKEIFELASKYELSKIADDFDKPKYTELDNGAIYRNNTGVLVELKALLHRAKNLLVSHPAHAEKILDRVKERSLLLMGLDPEKINYIINNARPSINNIEKAETVIKELLNDATHKLASKYLANVSIEVLAAKKSKKKSKQDPKAKVRNRGDVCFSAESPKVKDNKDHFPINSEKQARSALAYCQKFTKCPPWYKGTLKNLQETVRRKVHSKYPGIEINKSKKSK